MKRYLLLTSLLWLSIFFVWCNKQEIQPENNPSPDVIETQQPEVQDMQQENTQEINDVENNTTDEEGNNIEEENNEPKQQFIPWDYETDTHEDMSFEEIGNVISDCEAMWENPVCGKDWWTYFNRCVLEFAWIEEETELAEVVDWICVYK